MTSSWCQFVFIGGLAGFHSDKLRCCQWVVTWRRRFTPCQLQVFNDIKELLCIIFSIFFRQKCWSGPLLVALLSSWFSQPSQCWYEPGGLYTFESDIVLVLFLNQYPSEQIWLPISGDFFKYILSNETFNIHLHRCVFRVSFENEIHAPLLKTGYDNNFVVPDDTNFKYTYTRQKHSVQDCFSMVPCHDDNLWSHQWWQSWHYDNSRGSDWLM